eukprot:201844-Lingulodinium_polyedra.AAC.1
MTSWLKVLGEPVEPRPARGKARVNGFQAGGSWFFRPEVDGREHCPLPVLRHGTQGRPPARRHAHVRPDVGGARWAVW